MMTAEDNNWVAIYSSNLLHEVEIMHGVLAEHGIESIIVNKKDSFYLIGEAELYVNSGQALVAKQIISGNPSE